MTEQNLVPEKSPDSSLEQESELLPSITKEDLTVVKGVGPSVAKILEGVNITSVKDLANTIPEDLKRIPGIGSSMSKKLINGAKEHLRNKRLNSFSDDRGPVIEEKTLDSQIIHQVGEVDDIDDEQDFVIENEIYSNEVKNHTEIFPDEFDEYDDEDQNLLESINEQDILSKPAMTFESVSLSKPVVIEPQIKPQNIPSTTIDTKAFIEEELPIFPPRPRESTEVLIDENLQLLENKVMKKLEQNGFHIINNSTQLEKIFSNINILAVKHVSDFNYGNKKEKNEIADFFFIIPIKISSLKGPLIVSKDTVEYSATEKGNDYYAKRLILSFLKALEKASEIIKAELLRETSLRKTLHKNQKFDLCLEKTITKRKLYFYSGDKQVEILVEPVLITQNKVGFTEKVLPFAYQNNSNTHILQLEQLSDFIEYIEKKYILIESHSEKKSLMVLDREARSCARKRLKVGIPFISIFLVYIIVFILQAYSLLSIVNRAAIGLLVIMVLIIGFIDLAYVRTILGIIREFFTPYHERDLQLDDMTLTLIKEDLSPVFMQQLSYECIGKNPKSEIIDKIEKENSQIFLQEKTLAKGINDIDLFEGENEENIQDDEKYNTSQVKKELIEKYSSFLED